MTMPIEWHERNLRNMRLGITATLEHIDRARRELDERIKWADFLESQIKRAKKEGKMSFDEDRYNKPMVKRGG